MLSSIDREQGPFHVMMDGLSGGAELLECQGVARIVPGKRVVCPAAWQGKKVFAKFYLGGSGAAGYWKRELRGLRALRDRHIPSPKILHQGTVDAGSAYLALLEAIPSCRNFSEVWNESLQDHDRGKYLHRLVELIALQHEHGLEHRDPHLDNFLVGGDQLYTLDGDAIVVTSGPLADKRSLNNLGLVLAQLEPRYDSLAKQALIQYCQRRAWSFSVDLEHKLTTYIKYNRKKRCHRYLRKVFRECTEFVCQKDYNQFVIYRRDNESEVISRLLADPSASLKKQDARMLKDGNTCTVWSTPIDDRRLVIKRYNLKGKAHAFNRALRKTRAAISWENAHRLLFYGIATAMPIALVEERRGPFRGRAYYIAEFVEGPHCVQQLRDNEKLSDETRLAAEKIAALLADLAMVGITHCDMKGSNILFRNGQPVLVDLDAMAQYKSRRLFVRKHRRDLRRFLENWQ
ncbi:MAG: lipopolysaccharide kinase InaA family protein, partial [Gammaproteobacteria bacterium]